MPCEDSDFTIFGPQNYGPHFTHTSSHTVRRFWSAFYPLTVRRSAFYMWPPKAEIFWHLLLACQTVAPDMAGLELELELGLGLRPGFNVSVTRVNVKAWARF